MGLQGSGKRLGLGIIGYGPWGQHMARMALNTTRAWVPMIWTRGEETAARIRAAGFEATNDVDELVANPEVEAVAVFSPNALHKEHCLKVCAARKPLLATKPLVLTLEDYDAIVAAVEAAGIVNHLDFGMRYNPPNRFLLELVDAGAFGAPLHFISRSSRATGLHSLGRTHKAVLDPDLSGGWIIHHMCHQVDYALRLTRQRVVRVYAQAVRSAADCPSDESIAAILTTERGAILEVADGLTTLGLHHLSLLGSRATAYVDAEKRLIVRGWDDANAATPGYGGVSQCHTPEGWGDDSLLAFLCAVSGQPHGRSYALHTVPIREGRHVLEVLLAMRESAATGRPVALAPP